MEYHHLFRHYVQTEHPYEQVYFNVPMATINNTVREIDAYVLNDEQQCLYLYGNIFAPFKTLKFYGNLIQYPDSAGGLDNPFETMISVRDRLFQKHGEFNCVMKFVLSSVDMKKAKIMRYSEKDLEYLYKNNCSFVFKDQIQF